MNIDQVAVQLYTVREAMNSPQEAAGSLKKIKDIGYSAVQITPPRGVDDNSMKQMLEDTGLTCCSTHDALATLLKNPESVAERLDFFDCQYTAMPFPRDVDLSNSDEVNRMIEQLNAAAEALNKRGKTLCYHHHELEFTRIDGAMTVLDRVMEQAPAIAMEPDTYWIQMGGFSPQDYLKKYPNRIPLLHIKDWTVKPDRNITTGEIGYGNFDWKAILQAADAGNVQWYIIEQDHCEGNPFDALQLSWDYIVNNLV